MQKLLIILISIILINNRCFSQDISDSTSEIYSKSFFNYLVNNSLYNDALTLLKSSCNLSNSASIKDSLNLSIARLFILINMLDSANKYFKKVNVLPDSTSTIIAIETALSQEDTLAAGNYVLYYRHYIKNSSYKLYMLSIKMYNHQHVDSSEIQSIDSAFLTDIIKEYCRYQKKSPLKAGFLSAIIPGIGKRYLGYNHQAWQSLLINASLASVMIEIMVKNTMIVPWVASISLFTAFYIGNILGTVLLAKKIDVDFQKQVNEKIAGFYNNRLLHF